MYNYSNRNILVLLITFIIDCFNPDIGLAIARSVNFKPVADVNGSVYCATSQPTSVFAVRDLVGIPEGVPDAVRCGYLCTGIVSCTSYNYRTDTAISVDKLWTSVCELFDNFSHNCTTLSITFGCTLYQVCANEILYCWPIPCWKYIAGNDWKLSEILRLPTE